MHVPCCDTEALAILSFADARREEQTARVEYDKNRWVYIPCHYAEYRYLLGTKGKNPLICIGINPSTAAPDDLDNTLKSVERIAAYNGFDSFIMFNVYAQRATRPDDMDRRLNREMHEENMKAFEYVLQQVTDGNIPTVWAAWGAIIEKRDYLPQCVRDMVTLGNRYGARWVCAGPVSKKGHPHHPLYLRKDSPVVPFAIDEYLDHAPSHT